ncbi:MAG: UDP-N-acetylmuramoyl-L-alanine--D-glutamate ligase [Pusillimonas sp.]
MNTFAYPSMMTERLTLIMGLGETGMAAARWCARHGASLRIVDTRSNPAGLDTLKADLAAVRVEYCLGETRPGAGLLEGVGQVVLSPGLSPHEEPVKGFLLQAKAAGIEVIGEIELFARALADMASQGYTPYVLAVTGTNGKTTVTAMTRHVLVRSGVLATAVGNISPAALSGLMDALDAGQLPQAWVLELSSFQLESTYSLVPDAAVVLNITQDHLDWHGSMESYAAAKARLLGMAKIAIVNRDDAQVAGMVGALDGIRVRTFGRGAPELAGDLGLVTEHGVNWLCVSEPADFDLPVSSSRRRAVVAEARSAGRLNRLMPVDALRIRGVHNALNALAALALVRALDLGWADILHGLRDYAGEPNRTEFVRNVAGVDFINDSKGTNVGATLAALEGLGQTVVLIAGGLGKGQDFSVLMPVVRTYASGVVLIGQDGPVIGQALASAGVRIEQADDMDSAVRKAMAMATPGQAVLLSPACASMDMFRNYAHRAQAFIAAVNDLALDHGEVA